MTLVPSEDGAPKASGELVAVDGGRICVRTKEGLRDFDAASLREVRVRRHHFTAGWAVRWGLLGRLASGVAMAAACGSVEGNSGGHCASAGAIWEGHGPWWDSWPHPVSTAPRRSRSIPAATA